MSRQFVTWHDIHTQHGTGSWSLTDGMLTVRTPNGQKSAQVGNMPADALARLLLWELAHEREAFGGLRLCRLECLPYFNQWWQDGKLGKHFRSDGGAAMPFLSPILLPLPTDGGIYADDINDLGLIVGTNYLSDDVQYAFSYQGGVYTGYSAGGSDDWGQGVNDLGQILVMDHSSGYIVQPDGQINFLDAGPYGSFDPTDFNNNGDIIGLAYGDGTNPVPDRNGSFQDLSSSFPGGFGGRLHAINDAGVIGTMTEGVVRSEASFSRQHLYPDAGDPECGCRMDRTLGYKQRWRHRWFL